MDSTDFVLEVQAMRIVNREEARSILECISLTLARSIVSMAIAHIRTSRELAKALNMSIRSAQRLIDTLESIKAIKVVRYGKQKIIDSLNKHFEKEVLRSIVSLLPLIIDSLRIPPLKAPDRYREVTLQLIRALGINARPKGSVVRIVKTQLSNELKRKPIPRWLKRVAKVRHAYGLGSDGVKQPRWYPDEPYYGEVSMLVPDSE